MEPLRSNVFGVTAELARQVTKSSVTRQIHSTMDWDPNWVTRFLSTLLSPASQIQAAVRFHVNQSPLGLIAWRRARCLNRCLSPWNPSLKPGGSSEVRFLGRG